MKTHVLANEEVCIELVPGEHIALARSLYYLMADIRPGEIAAALAVEPVFAYQFVYAVYRAEAAALASGVAWLQGEEAGDVVECASTPPVAPIDFTDAGATWHLTLEQLWFIESCTTEVARRAF